jgi:transposase
MDSRETVIELAIQDYYAGVYKSQRAAAKAYGVSRTTFQDRLKGKLNRATAY